MAREAFQQELQELLEDVVRFGGEVEGSMDDMVAALESGDAAPAESRLGIDALYKERGRQIDGECLILQARQAPVARDLRLIYTVQAVNNHLVRSGTLAEHVCRAVAETAGHERNEDLAETLAEMARTARNLFHRGLDIFRARDVQAARELQVADDKVDLLYSEAMNLVANPPAGQAGTPEWRTRAALMVHYLERIADHGVDIGGRTVFLVTGERIEDAMSDYLDRDLREE